MKTRLETDQTVFKVYKGVKCFDFSKDKNIIVTGGMDRIVRLWNPYVSGYVFMLFDRKEILLILYYFKSLNTERLRYKNLNIKIKTGRLIFKCTTYAILRISTPHVYQNIVECT